MKTFIGLMLFGIGLCGTASARDHDPLYDRNRHRVGAPEIDPASAASALALLAGGLLILRGRRNTKGTSI